MGHGWGARPGGMHDPHRQPRFDAICGVATVAGLTFFE